MEIVSEGLRFNNTILGIHLKGNEGEVDPWGFVKKEEDGNIKPQAQKMLAENQYMNRI